jgi:DNA-binding PadR family transcriptional regulator
MQIWLDTDQERLIGKGDLRYMILASVGEGPRHGYEVIRLLEDRLGGLYTPSAGAVYPMLRSLEEAGLVSAVSRDGKKIYTITDAGIRFLAENRQVVESIWSRLEGWLDSETNAKIQAVRNDLRTLHRMFGRKANTLWTDADKLEQSRAAISRAVGDIEAILASDAPDRAGLPGRTSTP